jgi:acetate kinase
LNILVANPGSTSLKVKLFRFPEEKVVAQGKIERIGQALSPWQIQAGGQTLSGEEPVPDYGHGVSVVLGHLMEGEKPVLRSLDDLAAVGFKAVHAGKLGTGPGATPLTDEVLAEMERMLIAAPAHNRAYLQAIRCFAEAAPAVPRIALFEPAFHATITEEKWTCGLPLAWRDEHGLRRYGFHGASHRYIATRAPVTMGLSPVQAADLRLISCHLGGSSSLCAILGGRSVDTTMEFSPQSGIVHSTRCETIDPMIVLCAIQEMGLSVEQVADILCKESGLLGISGVSGDMRDLAEAAASSNARARLATEVFFHQVRRQIGAMAVSLEGVDAVVFTGGIGENGVAEREAICRGLEFLGLQIDPDANARARGVEACISDARSPAAIWVIPTDEELIVAREVAALLT